MGELKIIVLNIKSISRFLIQELKINLSFISVWITCMNNIIDLNYSIKQNL